MSNEKRTAVVTGASRGIGAATATAFAQLGYNVVLNCSSESSEAAAQELAEQLAATHGVTTKVIRADVSDFEAVKQVAKDIKNEFGTIDVLVNNAGITRDGLLMRMKEEDFDRVLEVNLKGAFNCIRHMGPVMMKQRYGRIINLSSVAGVAGNAGQINYSASKAGIIGLTKSAAKEMAPRGVTVNAVAPGFIVSDMTDALPEQVQQQARERIASGEFGTPEDVAYAITALADERAGYITGQVIRIDGGMAI